MMNSPKKPIFRSDSEYDLVICDIDGCLSPESHAPMNEAALCRITEYNRRALRDRDRPLVTLCSGRPIGFVEALCRLLHNTVAPAIGENGVWLYFPDRNGFEMDPNISQDQLDIVHEASKLLRDRYSSKGVMQQPGKAAAVSLYHEDTDYLRSIMPEVREIFQQRDWPFRVSMTWLYINCDLKQVSKASGIERLFERTGVERTRAAGIGDTMGDRFVADNVSFFACPANAESEIKERAHYVSRRKEADGVLDILDQLISRPR